MVYADTSAATPATPNQRDGSSERPSMPRLSPSKALATSLLQDCHKLISELAEFRTHLSAFRKPNAVDLRHFNSVVHSELKSLEKLAEQADRLAEEYAAQQEQSTTDEDNKDDGDNDGESDEGREGHQIPDAEVRLLHSLRSSNLPFHETLWNVSKTMCSHLVGFSKRFYWYEAKGRKQLGKTGREDMATLERYFRDLQIPDQNSKKAVQSESQRLQKRSVLVDIVADNGEEWIKVSTLNPNRLLFELAKLGWEAGMDSGSELEGEDSSSTVRLQHDDDSGTDDEDVVELVKLAADMKKAAALVRVRYNHPRIRLILPKVVEGQFTEIDKIIRDIRKTGAVVQCGTGLEGCAGGQGASEDASRSKTSPPLETVLPSMLPEPFPYRTDTLNVDCTLLLALVSDVSHVRDIGPSPNHHRAITRQIEMETNQPLVPYELWPAMGDKALLCTEEARTRMQEIVTTIGTDTEKTRTRLLMGETDGNLSRDELISQFQQLSDHKVPPDWKIPIRVVDAHAEIGPGRHSGRLPPLARKVEAQLSDINNSVFLYGWASGLTTISSNRTVVKQIEALVEEHRDFGDDVEGPNVWVCDTARSLIGKENNRRSR